MCESHSANKLALMRITEGVEWAVHACVMLAPLPPKVALSVRSLAEFHEVPAPYMAKQMQKLSAAGIVQSTKGRSGGYRLARPPESISLLDIFEAIEGKTNAFRCTEIRQKGPCPVPRSKCRKRCNIAQTFLDAEGQFKVTLQRATLGQMVTSAGDGMALERSKAVGEWYSEHIRFIDSG